MLLLPRQPALCMAGGYRRSQTVIPQEQLEHGSVKHPMHVKDNGVESTSRVDKTDRIH